MKINELKREIKKEYRAIRENNRQLYDGGYFHYVVFEHGTGYCTNVYVEYIEYGGTNLNFVHPVTGIKHNIIIT